MPRQHRINPTTHDRSLDLRRNATRPEQVLWSALRSRQLDGFKFRRQHPVGSYIVDFFCSEAQLVVEVDGDSHSWRAAEDARRQAAIEEQGHRVLRVTNDEVLENLDGVVEMLVNALREGDRSPSPSPSLEGRGTPRGKPR